MIEDVNVIKKDDGTVIMVPFKHANSRQMNLIQCLAFSQEQIANADQIVKERLKMRGMSSVYGRFCGIRTQLHNIFEDLFYTMPPKQVKHLNDVVTNYTMNPHPKRVSSCCQTAIFSRQDIKILCAAALNGECSYCIKQGKQIKKCQLRKVLTVIMPDNKADRITSCCYSHGRVNMGD